MKIIYIVCAHQIYLLLFVCLSVLIFFHLLLFHSHTQAAVMIHPHSAQNTIANTRAKIFRKLPATLRDFVDMKDQVRQNVMSSYYGYFDSSDGKRGVVFTSKKLLGAIGHHSTNELFIDGTFDVSRLLKAVIIFAY